MVNNNEHDRATPGGVNALPELVFDLSQDKSKPATFGRTQTPVNQLPELSWDCSKPKTKTAGRATAEYTVVRDDDGWLRYIRRESDGQQLTKSNWEEFLNWNARQESPLDAQDRVFPESHKRTFFALLNSLVTDEELDEAEKRGGGGSLADFWTKMGRT